MAALLAAYFMLAHEKLYGKIVMSFNDNKKMTTKTLEKLLVQALF